MSMQVQKNAYAMPVVYFITIVNNFERYSYKNVLNLLFPYLIE